ncbi:hypothetical protein HanXRQr2_Chr15g0705271 [Helianthus annuus]|uniref:Uncharacterized protein n=1 Tax=Helianthus annuus TaxID=4232 RepID=A0A9K3E213_HELAN|nr:hypothetical protein HanXRQr2_Chr15g0705271 [Helianthus annuus]
MVGGGWSAVLVLEAVSLMWRSEQKRGRVSLMWTWSAYVDATAVSGGCRRRTGVGGRYPCDGMVFAGAFLNVLNLGAFECLNMVRVFASNFECLNLDVFAGAFECLLVVLAGVFFFF